MLFFCSFSLFLSATVAFALRFPRYGVAGRATSPMITEREPSAPSIVCGSAGTDKENPAAYSGPHASSIQDCLGKCRGSSGCQSVAFDQSTSTCLLYKAPVSGNINYDGSQHYQFYDLSCPQGGSSGTGISITSVVTLTVTGAPIIATSTVIVIVTPAPTTPSSTSTSTSTLVVFVTVTQGAVITVTQRPTSAPAPTTPSSTSTSTSTLVVVVTVTQGVPLSSTSAPVIETRTSYATLSPTITSLPNPPTSTPPASTLSTITSVQSSSAIQSSTAQSSSVTPSTTTQNSSITQSSTVQSSSVVPSTTAQSSSSSIAPTSSSPASALPSPGGLLCDVVGWSTSNTSFFDNSGNLGNQVACELACRVVSCGSYGFSNTTCLAYPGSVSQSVVLDPNSHFRFFDAGCNLTSSHT